MSVLDIQNLLDSQLHDLSAPWCGTIKLSLFPIKFTDDDKDVTEILKMQPRDINICDYIGGKMRDYKKLYFCPQTYPSPPDGQLINTFVPWKSLKRDLEVAALHCGNKIICNGGGSRNKTASTKRRFVCGDCYRQRKQKGMAQTLHMPYRSSSLVHDRLNSRGKLGLNGPKRVKTTNTDNICKFCFTVSCDNYGFFVDLNFNNGNPLHIGHPKPLPGINIPLPTRLLSEEEKEDIVNVHESSGNNVAGRNFMRGKFGKFLNSMKVDYLKRKKNANNGAESDDIEFMLESFYKSKEIHFTTLTDMPMSLLDLKDNQNESHQSESTTIFPHMFEGSCGWHIVNQGWKANVGAHNLHGKKKQRTWNAVVKTMHKWMYSWMWPQYVESPEEYAISKFLLLRFINSSGVLKACNGNTHLIKSIINFVTHHVFVHEDLYLHYSIKHIQHFNVAHTSNHEGTNLGLKNHSIPMLATMNLDTAAKNLNAQSDLKAAEIEESIYYDYQRNVKHWSSHPTSPFTTTLAEGIISK
ncbi:hypothetical protein ACHAXS_005615, partial [Conticribra weissflogii]